MTRQADATAKEIDDSTKPPKPSAVRRLDMGEESDAVLLEPTESQDDANIIKMVEMMEEDAEAAVKALVTPKQADHPAGVGLKRQAVATKQPREPWKNALKIDKKAIKDTPAPDSSNPWKRMKKLHVVRPDFDVIYADVLVKLNNSNYLLYGCDSEDRPIIRIQDCGYKRADCAGEGAKYVPRCVKLTPRQWMELLDIGEEIIQALKEDEDKRAHIGRNTFVTVKSDRAVIDIRDYFLPPDDNRDEEIAPCQFFDDLVPTKRGVQLSVSGWQMLIGKAASVLKDFAATTIDYTLGTCEHNGQSEYMACNHCNPNGWHLWRMR